MVDEEPEKEIISVPICVHKCENSKGATGTEKRYLSSTFRTTNGSEMQAEMRVPLRHPTEEHFTGVTNAG